MELMAKAKNSEPIPAGLHQAVCTGVYDLGTQYNEKFKKNIRKCLISWEFPEERIKIEKDEKTIDVPRELSKQYTLTLSAKSGLLTDLVSWRGRPFTPEELKGFNLHQLLGVNALIQVIHTEKDGRTYANIKSITPLYKNMVKKEAENPLNFFSFNDNNSIPETTPQWIVEIIKKSVEWNERNQGLIDTE